MTRAAALLRRPVLEGHRPVAGLWLPADWFDVPTRQRLIVAAWRPGSQAWRFDDGDLLRWPEPTHQDCASLPGWPLQRVAAALCSADVSPTALAGGSSADLWLAAGGELVGRVHSQAQPLDPSAWIALEALAWHEAWDLSPPAADRVFVGLGPGREARDVLGDLVPPTSAEARSFLQALRDRSASSEAASRASTARRAPPTHGSPPRGRGWGWVGVPIAVVLIIAAVAMQEHQASELAPTAATPPNDGGMPLGWILAIVAVGVLVGLWRGRSGSGGTGFTVAGHAVSDRLAAGSGQSTGRGDAGSGAGAGGEGRSNGASNKGNGSALRERLRAAVTPQRWRAWAARLAMTSGVAQLIGRQHAAYLRRMLELFEDGRIEEALRHAVPLGSDEGSLGQLLGRLAPRQDLSLKPRGGGGPTVNVDDVLQQHLQKLYRATFERLDREGRVEEAAYVLAELLRVRPEALDYLEKHGRVAQAAELALGWDMPAPQIIRLLALAGDWTRALLVARRDNAFAAAVLLIEKRAPDVAARLRREWADSLVSQGRWLAAIQALWPVRSERANVGEWLEIVEASGGAAGARALALRAQCLPETIADRGALLAALRDDPSLANERVALAEQLLGLEAPVSAEARRLAGAIAGRLLADHAAGGGPLDAVTLRRVVDLAGDPLLAADVPSRGYPASESRALLNLAEAGQWMAPDAGSMPIHDAVPLADHDFLVALGEAGLLRVDARGRHLGRLDTPAHRLVVAFDGRSALALAQRGETWRVNRIDLVRWRATDLGLLRAQAFAPRYDGVAWTIATGTRVQVLDTTDDGLRSVIWQVADLPGPVVAIDSSPLAESWLVDDGERGLQAWSYALPKRQLQCRDPLPVHGSDVRVLAVAGLGVIQLRHDEPTKDAVQIHGTPTRAGRWPACPLPASGHVVAANPQWIAMRGSVAALPSVWSAGSDLVFAPLMSGRVQARVSWPVESPAMIRAIDDGWILFDAEGRLARLSASTGRFEAFSIR